MTTTRDDIHRVVEQLPSAQFHAAIQYLRYLRDFSDPVMLGLPEDREYDEELSPEDIAAIEDGLKDVRAGRLTPIQDVISETALLSEAALSDWNRPEEDEAWAHLQPDP